MDDKSKELSIIVYSCLRNKDMWPFFLHFFKKNWSDCEFKLLLLTDYYEDINSELSFDEVVCIDSDWSEMIKFAIKKANTPFVMLFMDDFFLTRKVNNVDIEQCLKMLKENKAVFLNFSHPPFAKYSNFLPNFLKIESGTPYSLSLQVGIWDASFLISFVRDQWSPWDFERKGSLIKLNADQLLLAACVDVLPYVETVRRGKWLPQGKRICRENRILVDYCKRPAMNVFDVAVMEIKGILLRLFPKTILHLQAIIDK